MSTEADGFAPADDVFKILDAIPGINDNLAERKEARVQMEREHASGLATIRSAAAMTQKEVALKLGITQTSVSRMENRPDLLLSTLKGYLDAVGAEATITLHVGEVEKRINLNELV